MKKLRLQSSRDSDCEHIMIYYEREEIYIGLIACSSTASGKEFGREGDDTCVYF
jgi:hypothetical protein